MSDLTLNQRNCLKKLQYKTVEQAEKAVVYFVNNGGKQSWPYQCPCCKLFHLTCEKPIRWKREGLPRPMKQPRKIKLRKIAQVKTYKKSKPRILLVQNWSKVRGDLDKPIIRFI